MTCARQTGHENLEDAFVALSGLEPEPAAEARGTRRTRHRHEGRP